MDEINVDCLTKKDLVCKVEDLQKLDTPEGCTFKVNHTVSSDASGESESSTDEFYHKHNIEYVTEDEKLKAAELEYLKLLANCENDLIESRQTLDLNSRFENSIKANYLDVIMNYEQEGFKKVAFYVYKKLVEPGSGPEIDEQTIVVYNCAFWTENRSEPYDSSWSRNDCFVSNLGIDCSILPGVRDILLTMRVGEIAEAYIQPQAAFGKLGVPPRIPEDAIIYCVIEVVKAKEKSHINLLADNPKLAQQELGISFEDFYNSSNDARQRGNFFLESGQFKVAIRRYKSGIRILETISYKDEAEELKANQLLVKLYTNMARAAISDGFPKYALTMCKLALRIDQNNPKIYYHQMMACRKLEHLDRALVICARAKRLFNSNIDTIRCFERIEGEMLKEITSERKRKDDLFRAMGSMVAGKSRA